MLRSADIEDEAGLFFLRPALYISERGADETTAALHNDSTAYEVSAYTLYADRVEYVSDDADLSLVDALRRIVRLSGGSFTDKRLVDGFLTATTSTWTVLPVDTHDNTDFIADIDVPVLVSTATDVKVGVIFRSSVTVDTTTPDEGYFLCIEGAYLCLYTIDAGALTLVRKCHSLFSSGHRHGRFRFSIQGNRFSVWQGQMLINSIFDDGCTGILGSYNCSVIIFKHIMEHII